MMMRECKGRELKKEVCVCVFSRVRVCGFSPMNAIRKNGNKHINSNKIDVTPTTFNPI